MICQLMKKRKKEVVNDCEENMEAIRDIYSEFNGMQEADQNVARQMMDRMKEIIKQNGNPVRGSDHYSVMENYQKMGLLQHIAQIFRFFHRVLRAKGEPHGTVADLFRHTDAQQHVAGVKAVGVAGRAGRGADAVHIEVEQDGLALQTREADVDVAGQTMLKAAVQTGLGDVLQDAVDDVVTQLLLVGHPLFQMLGRHLEGLAHAGDAGDVAPYRRGGVLPGCRRR